MTATISFEPYFFAPDDPLAEAHAAVVDYGAEVGNHFREHGYGREVDPKEFPAGKKLLAAKSEKSAGSLRAALPQVRHWSRVIQGLPLSPATPTPQATREFHANRAEVIGRHRSCTGLIAALLRRSLPLTETDLAALLDWYNHEPYLWQLGPIGQIAKTLESVSPGEALRDAMTVTLQRLRESDHPEARKWAARMEQTLAASAPQQSSNQSEAPAMRLPPPSPAPAGTPGILEALKRRLGMLDGGPEPATTQLDPDRFPLPENSPLRSEHALLGIYLLGMAKRGGYQEPQVDFLLRQFVPSDVPDDAVEVAIRSLEPASLGRIVLAAAERHIHALLAPLPAGDELACNARYSTGRVIPGLLKRAFALSRDGLFDLLVYLASRPPAEWKEVTWLPAKLLDQVERESATAALSEGERYVLSLFRTALVTGAQLGARSDKEQRLTRLIGDGVDFFLVPGEVWVESLNGEISKGEPAKRPAWTALLHHSLTADASRPTAKWLTTARKLADDVGPDIVAQTLVAAFPNVSKGQTGRPLASYVGDVRNPSDTMIPENAAALRGLLWLAPLLPRREELGRAITAVALSAYKKVPGIGPRAVKVGNAAVYALSQMASTHAVGQLAMLKVRVRTASAQKEIEKAFIAAAESPQLPRDEIEELGVPSYGLESVGRHEETLGEYRAELIVTGSDAELRWYDSRGKPLKSVPARVKADAKEDLKELQQSLKDVQAMLPAQRDRIDSLFLSRKVWPFSDWRERYLEHPLIGTIAQRLLWCVNGVPALFAEGDATDINGQPIACTDTAEVALWHPIGRSTDEVVAWRQRLETLGITQPFKQAHREVYLLTDAERNTNTYSNRFAAHVLRQHQFNALCAVRGWKNKLRMMVDSTYPPAARSLPQWGLRAEFWIEGAGDTFGADTNEAGAYLRLSTDQVRFYREQAAENYSQVGDGQYRSLATGPGNDNINEPLPLTEIPPLVFSEIMRDVDLFVGVASVGNDPNWQDGGPEGRYREYWQQYSFGELSGNAVTRREVLERLIPRMAIAGRCAFSDRFLVVRGDRRTYKIHLGSGNILMEPNDQYLCIVPDRSRAQAGDVFLPFEGDSMLSIIISKALLLASDTKIKDPSILQQIGPAR